MEYAVARHDLDIAAISILQLHATDRGIKKCSADCGATARAGSRAPSKDPGNAPEVGEERKGTSKRRK